MAVHEMHAALNRAVPVPVEETDNPYTTNHALYEVHNRRQWIVILSLVGGFVVMAGGFAYLATEIHKQKTIFIRENADGSTSILGDSEVYPTDVGTFKKCLREWAEDHYSLIRATAQIAYNRKQFYMSPALITAMKSEELQTKRLENFLRGTGLDIEAHVTNIMIEAPMKPPNFRAYLTLEKIYKYSDGREEKREKSVVQVVFTRVSTPPAYGLINPHGVMITFFTEEVDIA